MPDRLTPRDAPHQIVLIEDDPGDTLLFEVALGDADPDLRVTTANRIDVGANRAALEQASCIVLDLGLPGMAGFEALDSLVELLPATAVVVLTGWGDAQAGIDAVARGAQDYLVKGEVDGNTMARSIRFAIERKRSQLSAAALAESQLRQIEQHRLERALLVDPSFRRDDVSWTSRYIAARAGVVSGDFFDGIELPDGTIRMIVGDVAGHGADEAALGVSLRAGWRALVLVHDDANELLLGLEEFLETERTGGDEFATVCDLTIAADLSEVCVHSVGHPPPILAGFGALVDRHTRSPLGVHVGSREFVGTRYPLHGRWSIVAYTDGLFEVRGTDGVMLTTDEVPAAVDAATHDSVVDVDRLIEGFANRTDEGWRDDVAVMVVHRT